VRRLKNGIKGLMEEQILGKDKSLNVRGHNSADILSKKDVRYQDSINISTDSSPEPGEVWMPSISPSSRILSNLT
jgi:hypothetical protein